MDERLDFSVGYGWKTLRQVTQAGFDPEVAHNGTTPQLSTDGNGRIFKT